MSELKKLLKAREKLVAQREWAMAGAKYYHNVQLMAQASILDIEQAIEKIQAESQQSTGMEKTARIEKKPQASSHKQNTPLKSELPATSEGFWLGFLNQDGRRLAEVFDDALAALKKEHKFTPSADQCKKLRNRLAVALHGAARNKIVVSSGKGRDRLYSLPKSQHTPS